VSLAQGYDARSMRRCILLGVLTAALSATTTAWQSVGPAKYNVTETDAQSIAVTAVGGSFKIAPLSKMFLALPAPARAIAIDDAVAWAKPFVSSSAFQTLWTAEHERLKPTRPMALVSIDAEVEQEAAANRKQAADMRQALATLPADQRPQMETLIQSMEDLANSPAGLAKLRRTIENRRVDDEDRYQMELNTWRGTADGRGVIAIRLQEFLANTGDVDFSARTEIQDGKRIFVDEALEAKPAIWKICYRAGREATTAARAAATAWVRQLR